MGNNNNKNKFNNKNQKPYVTWIQKQVEKMGQGWIVQPNIFDVNRFIDTIMMDLAKTTWSEDGVDYKCYCSQPFYDAVYSRVNWRNDRAIIIANTILGHPYDKLDESHEITQKYRRNNNEFINIANAYHDINEALYIFGNGIKDNNGCYIRLPHDISVLIQLSHNLQGFKSKFLKLGIL